MAYFFCIAVGQADFTPDNQEYHCADSAADMAAIVSAACDQWVSEYNERPVSETRGDEFYRYEFRQPREGEDNYSQRLLIGGSDDWVLDVIGMTESHYSREMGGE